MSVFHFSHLKPTQLEALFVAFEQYQELIIVAEEQMRTATVKETGMGVILEINAELSHLHFFDLISWFHYKNLACSGWCNIDGKEYYLEVDPKNKQQDTLIGITDGGQRISCYLPDATIAYLAERSLTLKPASPRRAPFRVLKTLELTFDKLDQLETSSS